MHWPSRYVGKRTHTSRYTRTHTHTHQVCKAAERELRDAGLGDVCAAWGK